MQYEASRLAGESMQFRNDWDGVFPLWSREELHKPPSLLALSLSPGCETAASRVAARTRIVRVLIRYEYRAETQTYEYSYHQEFGYRVYRTKCGGGGTVPFFGCRALLLRMVPYVPFFYFVIAWK